MATRTIKEVRQIIPADRGWVMYAEYDEAVKAGASIICWAICVDEGGESFVTGMFGNPDGTLIGCCEINGFRNYGFEPK